MPRITTLIFLMDMMTMTLCIICDDSEIKAIKIILPNHGLDNDCDAHDLR